MIKRKNWTKKMLAVAACAGLLMTNPAFTEAATAAERSAYQAVFDADYYRSAYQDVAAAFGNNKAALFNHFVNYGLREGRSCSADFNPQAYRAKYADLQQAFGDDMAAYCRHYVTCGKAEGRDGGGTGSVSAATVTDAATTDTATVQGNVIGTCTTKYDATVPRAVNVELDSTNGDTCYVGRMRMDMAIDNALTLWVVGDQVRKGAALNAVQIAELLVNR